MDKAAVQHFTSESWSWVTRPLPRLHQEPNSHQNRASECTPGTANQLLIPSLRWSMAVAASCYGCVWQEKEDWSELSGGDIHIHRFHCCKKNAHFEFDASKHICHCVASALLLTLLCKLVGTEETSFFKVQHFLSLHNYCFSRIQFLVCFIISHHDAWNVFSGWRVWTADQPVQHHRSLSMEPCCCYMHRIWFSIVLMK